MEQGKTTVREIELAWQRSGASDSPVVWAHGLNSSRAGEEPFGLVDWSKTPELDVVRYDARGHGESGFSTEPTTYSWDNMARDQLELTEALGIDTYVAAGASLGAATALHAAVLAPERISKLLLVIPPTGWETRAAQADFYSAIADVIDTEGLQPIADGAKNLDVPDPFKGSDDWLELRMAGILNDDPVRMAGRFRGATTANLPDRAAVADIEAPTLILAWSGDPGHPVSSAEEILGLLPNASLDIASTFDELTTWTAKAADFLT